MVSDCLSFRVEHLQFRAHTGSGVNDHLLRKDRVLLALFMTREEKNRKQEGEKYPF